MKRFIVIFLILGAALLVIPGVIGFQAEERYETLLSRLEKSGMQVVGSSYQRDWFGSRAETELSLMVPASSDPGQAQSKEYRFTLLSQISHGLLTTEGLGMAVVESEILVDGQPVFPVDYPATIRTSIDLGGAGTTQVDLPQVEIAASGKRPRIRFGGIQGELTFSSDLDQADIHLNMNGLKLIEDDAKLLEIGRVELNSRSRLDASGLMLGGGQFEIAHLDIQDAGTGTRIRLDGIGIEVESSAEGGNVSGFALYRLESASMGDQVYGPARLKVAIDHISGKLMAKLQESLQQINTKQLSKVEKQMAVMSVLMESGPEFLKSDPRLAVEQLRVKTPDGIVEARFSIQSVGLEWKQVGDISAVLGKLVVEGSLRMPETLFRQLFIQQAERQITQQLAQRRQAGESFDAPDKQQLSRMAETAANQQLEQWLLQEMLVRDGGDITTKASLSDGLLTVNGKMLPIPIL